MSKSAGNTVDPLRVDGRATAPTRCGSRWPAARTRAPTCRSARTASPPRATSAPSCGTPPGSRWPTARRSSGRCPTRRSADRCRPWILGPAARGPRAGRRAAGRLPVRQGHRGALPLHVGRVLRLVPGAGQGAARGGEPRRDGTRAVLGHVLDALLRLLHPVVPFVTETLWTALTGGESVVDRAVAGRGGPRRSTPPRRPGSPTCRSWSPRSAGSAPSRACPDSRRVAARARRGVEAGRSARGRHSASLARLDAPGDGFAPTATVEVALSGGTVHVELDTSGAIDVAAERARLGRDLAAAQKELDTAEKKLGNPKFVEKAPDGGRRRHPDAPGRRRSRTSSGSPRGWRRCRREPGRRDGFGDPDFGGETSTARIDGRSRPPGCGRRASRGGRARARTGRGPEDAVLRHVLDAVRGGDTPDVVPATSRWPGFAEFLAVEAVLDKRWPETRMEPSLDRIAALVDAAGRPAARLPRRPPHRHQRQDLHGADGRRAAQRDRAAHRPVHQPAPAARHRADQHRQPADHAGALRRGLPRRGAVRGPRRRARTDVPLSKFEMLTAMGFAAFADAPVEAAVIEVGLGGRWDATNVVDGTVAVITPIGLDHAEYLGTDVLGIARDKAGIIKPGAVAVLGRAGPGRGRGAAASAASRSARRSRARAPSSACCDREIAVGGQRLVLQGLSGTYDEIFLPLHGEHQARNAALALAAVEALIGAGPQAADRSRRRAGGVRRGALARPAGAGRAGADVADRARRRRAQPARRPRARRRADHGVPVHPAGRRCVAVMRDKDVRGILAELEPVVAEVVVTANSSPRAMDPDELGALAVDGVRRRAGERRARAGAGDRAGPGAGRGGAATSGRRGDRHRLGRHGGGGAARCSGWSRHDASEPPARPGDPDPMKGLRGVYAAVLVLEAIVVRLALLVCAQVRQRGRRRWASR